MRVTLGFALLLGACAPQGIQQIDEMRAAPGGGVTVFGSSMTVSGCDQQHNYYEVKFELDGGGSVRSRDGVTQGPPRPDPPLTGVAFGDGTTLAFPQPGQASDVVRRLDASGNELWYLAIPLVEVATGAHADDGTAVLGGVDASGSPLVLKVNTDSTIAWKTPLR